MRDPNSESHVLRSAPLLRDHINRGACQILATAGNSGTYLREKTTISAIPEHEQDVC